jgi:death-on-curing protein
MIESAIARPYCGYYRSLAKKLAALIESVACNHGFIDGNKRTAAILALVLIEQSGYEISLHRNENLDNKIIEDLVLGSVCRTIDFDELVAWFDGRLMKA